MPGNSGWRVVLLLRVDGLQGDGYFHLFCGGPGRHGGYGAFGRESQGTVQQALDYAGSKTLYILTFHFISFKLVSLLKVWQYGLPMTELSSFPVIFGYNTFYWLFYSAVGVLLPILLWELNRWAGMALRRK